VTAGHSVQPGPAASPGQLGSGGAWSKMRINVILLILGSCFVMRQESAGYNDLGYTRIGPLNPLLYPDSVNIRDCTVQAFEYSWESNSKVVMPRFQ
jgi:hypothetical protein